MASFTLTVAAGGEAGAAGRQRAWAIERAAAGVPDRNPTGAATVLTIDDAVGSLRRSVSGSYTGPQVLV